MLHNDPFLALSALQRALESRIASDWMGTRTTGSGGYPPTNIFQQGENYVAIIELPGVDRAKLTVEAKENTVRIAGTKLPDAPKGAGVHRRERTFGAFDRVITLPIPIDPDQIRAEYNDGVLAVFLPPAESAKPRTIKVT